MQLTDEQKADRKKIKAARKLANREGRAAAAAEKRAKAGQPALTADELAHKAKGLAIDGGREGKDPSLWTRGQRVRHRKLVESIRLANEELSPELAALDAKVIQLAAAEKLSKPGCSAGGESSNAVAKRPHVHDGSTPQEEAKRAKESDGDGLIADAAPKPDRGLVAFLIAGVAPAIVPMSQPQVKAVKTALENAITAIGRRKVRDNEPAYRPQIISEGSFAGSYRIVVRDQMALDWLDRFCRTLRQPWAGARLRVAADKEIPKAFEVQGILSGKLPEDDKKFLKELQMSNQNLQGIEAWQIVGRKVNKTGTTFLRFLLGEKDCAALKANQFYVYWLVGRFKLKLVEEKSSAKGGAAGSSK